MEAARLAERISALEAGQRALEERVRQLERLLAAAGPEPAATFQVPEDMSCAERDGEITLTRHEGGGVALAYSTGPLHYATVFLDPPSQPSNLFIGLVDAAKLGPPAGAARPPAPGPAPSSGDPAAPPPPANPGYTPLQLADVAVFNVLGKARTPGSPWVDLEPDLAELLRGACRFDLDVEGGTLRCTVDKGRCVTVFSGLLHTSRMHLVIGVYGTGSVLVKYAVP